MTDGEVSETHKAIINEAFYLRGRIVGHYSHAEFLLGDFAVKCHSKGIYFKEDFKFPYRLESKLVVARDICASADVMKKYQNRISALIAEIMQFEEMRHFMAHGWMMLIHNSHQHLIEIRLYTKTKGEPFKLEIRRFTLEQMRSFSEEASDFVGKMISLFREIYLAEKLEQS